MRKIIHVDMDAFFASVEIRDNPALQGLPVAVGGRENTRGVVSTCNYEARQFGVHSAMPCAQAKRLCPELIFVPGRMSAYKEVSNQVRSIFARYTQLIEPLSLDEAYLDVTDCQQLQGSATWIALQIREAIFAETGLTASAGIAPKQAREFAANLALRKISGVGPKTVERLATLGLVIGKDVLKHTPAELSQWLGKFGPVLHQRAQGIDERKVEPNRIRKSVGVERTLEQDLGIFADCQSVMTRLLPELKRRLAGRHFKTAQVKLKFNDFNQTTVAHGLQSLSEERLSEMLRTAYQRSKGRSIRLVGISVTLADQQVEVAKQLDLELCL